MINLLIIIMIIIFIIIIKRLIKNTNIKKNFLGKDSTIIKMVRVLRTLFSVYNISDSLVNSFDAIGFPGNILHQDGNCINFLSDNELSNDSDNKLSYKTKFFLVTAALGGVIGGVGCYIITGDVLGSIGIAANCVCASGFAYFVDSVTNWFYSSDGDD